MFTAYRPGHTCSALKRSRRTRRSPSFLGTTNSNLSAVSALPTYPLARSLTQSLIRLSRKLFGNISRQASPASLLPSSSSPIAFITDDNWGDATEQTFSAASRQRRSEREGGRQAGHLFTQYSRAEWGPMGVSRPCSVPPTTGNEGIAGRSQRRYDLSNLSPLLPSLSASASVSGEISPLLARSLAHSGKLKTIKAAAAAAPRCAAL